MNFFDTTLELLKENSRLSREADVLVKGVSRQAATIRTLNERNSILEAEVTKLRYETELLKAQGRKTRSKFRALKQAYNDARSHLGQALSRAERAEDCAERHYRVAEERFHANRRLDAIVHNKQNQISFMKNQIERLLKQLAGRVTQPAYFHYRDF